MRSTQVYLKLALNYIRNRLHKLRSQLGYVASRNNAQLWINSDMIWLSFSHRLFHTCMAYYFWDVTRDWNHDFARCGDVTKARDKKQTVLCPLLISNHWTGSCCELKCTWFYCLLRSYKSTLQLCGLSEHVNIAFNTNQKWVTPERFVCTLKGSGTGLCSKSLLLCEYYTHCSFYMHNMSLKRIRQMRNKWRVVSIYILPPVRQFQFLQGSCGNCSKFSKH